MTAVECKKHVTQMSTEEKFYLISKLKEVEAWKPSIHFKERAQKRKGDFEKAVESLDNGHIFEYRMKNGDMRIAVRSNIIHKNKNACVVFSILTKEIVTFYWNSTNDNHTSLNYSEYDEKIDVVRSIRHLKAQAEERKKQETLFINKFKLDLKTSFEENLINDTFKEDFVDSFVSKFTSNLQTKRRFDKKIQYQKK